MSGLCGWIGEVGAPGEAIRTMADSLPQFEIGVREEAYSNCAGLAIRAHSAEGSWCRDGSLVAAVEGNPRWQKAKLASLARERGHAAALIRAWIDNGESLLNDITGDFGFALIDLHHRHAFLAIDRFGIRTMNFGTNAAGELFFGSTLDALRATPGAKATVRPQTIYKFLYFVDRIPAPDSIYEEYEKILPGHSLTFDEGHARINRYWRMPYVAHETTDFSWFRERLFSCLEDAVSRTINEEDTAKIGAFLSGGLDSSSVVGFLQQQLQDHATKSITVAFSDAQFDESGFAKIAAEHFGTDHHVYVAQPQDVLTTFETIARFYDEPFANSSAIAAYLAARKAKEVGVDLLLAGDGGDELFGGNSRYLDDSIFDCYQCIPYVLRRFFLEPAADLAPNFVRTSYLRRAFNYVDLARMTSADRLLRNNIFQHIPPVDVFHPDVYSFLDIDEPRRFADTIFVNCPSHDKLHRMFEFDMRVTLADSDLRKVVRMCELAGVRVKFPFLDEDLAAFSATVSPSLLMQDKILRYAFKKAMEGFLPASILTKKKHGFGLPYVDFVRDNPSLRALFCDVLANLAKRKLFKQEFLSGLIGSIVRHNNSPVAGVSWDLAVLEVWLASRSISLT